MINVRKGNKELTIDETAKAAYLAEGYDIINAKGEVEEAAPSKTVPYTDYCALKKELETLKKRRTKEKEEEKPEV